MADKKTSGKKKLIIIIAAVVAVLLLIGSFFLRDIAIRAGLDEYEQKEIELVKSKYAQSFDGIARAAEQSAGFRIVCRQKGLFEKSEIIPDENGAAVYEAAKEHTDVLCHTYCYGIYKKDGRLYFEFNKSGTKLIVLSPTEPEKSGEKDIVHSLGDGWYYLEIKEKS